VAAGPAAAKQVTWFGVYTQEITPDLREGLDYNGSGVLVTRVVPDSPADRAGIQRGDVITRLGSSSVESHDQLAEIVRQSPSGRRMDVQVVRGGNRQSLTVTLASRDDTDSDQPRAYSDDDQKGNDEGGPDLDVPAPPSPPRMIRGGDLMPDMRGMMLGRGRLGVRVQDLNPDLADYFGSRTMKGALVVDVTEGSAADQAGLHAGDVITKVGTKSIEDGDDLIEAVRSSEGAVSITVLRHGSTRTLQATLDPMSKTMQFRRGPNTNRWRDANPGPDSRDMRDRARNENDDLRRMVDDLRKEVDDLKQQLDNERNK